MKAILIIFLFCILYFEKAKGQHSLRETSLYWSNKAPSQAIKDGTVASKQTKKKSGRKHKKGKSVRRNKKQRSKKQKEKRERIFKRKDKKGAQTKGYLRRSKNEINKNAKRANKKKRGEKKTKKKRNQKKKKWISRKRQNKNRKQNRYYKKNIKRTKSEKMRKLRKKFRKEYKSKERKRSKKQKQKQQRAHQRRAFYGPNGDGVQEFKCDIYGYTRDFSVALTQKNRANRIKKKPEKMDRLARTDFTDAINALGAATRGGTGCYGSNTAHNNFISEIIYRNLQFCKNDVPSICDTKKIVGYDDAAKTNAEMCFKSLGEFSNLYRSSLFNGPGKKYENVCTSFGNSWNSTATGNIEDAVANNSAGTKIKSPYTPLELWRDHCLPNTLQSLDKALLKRFGVCMDPPGLIPGSYGSCMTFLQESMLFVDICNPYPAMFGTITAFYTWVKVQDQILVKIIQTLEDLRPFNITRRLYDSNENNRTRITPNLNFATVINMMSGTNCTSTEEYDILINCNVTVPNICNAEPFNVKWEELAGVECCVMMEKFTKDYELIADSILQTESSQVTGNRQDNLNSSISGYNLPLIANCTPVFCFSYYNEECSLNKQNYKVTNLAELNKEFFISFEFRSKEGPPTTNKSQNVIQLMDTENNPVLFLSVIHNHTYTKNNKTHHETILIICSYTFDSENNCKNITNVFTADNWHHVEFTQAFDEDTSKYIYQVKIDGSKKVSVTTDQPKTFTNVDVYTHWTQTSDTIMGSVRNMFINKKSSKTENQCKVSLVSARSSSTQEDKDDDYGPKFAIDEKNFTSNKNFFLSNYEDYPWLEVKLSAPANVSGVTIIMSGVIGQSYLFKKAVVTAGPNRIDDDTRAEMLTNNPICGTYEGPAATGSTINIQCTSPIVVDYVSVQLNYTDALLAVEEIKVNPQESGGNDYTFLNELKENITKANCLTNEFSTLDANTAATFSACVNETLKGSYASCDAARSTAYVYINSCVRPTTIAPSTTTGIFVTLRSNRRRKQFYKEKFMAKKYSK